jgi:NodT family efflux transporter outer membrane factor (OMF) lipoprotein
MRIIPQLPLLAVAALLGACTVGPNYAGPPKSASADPAARFVRAGDTVSMAAPALDRWWTTLGDPVLDTLEARALADNPGIAVAQARVLQARGALNQERANALPKANASASYLHAQLPGVDLGSSNGQGGSTDLSSLDFYSAGFDASWEIDLFGGQRRTIEAARASLGNAEANVADAQVSLTAEVAQAYVDLRDRQQRLALATQSVAMQRQMLALTRQRFDRGTASELDVERLSNQAENSDAALLPLSAEADSYRNALAVLTGAEPGAVDAMLAAQAAVPLPPAAVPVGDPAELLQRRPDIRAAERALAAQTAKIGSAEAARFPRLSFMGLIGIGGTTPGDLANLGDISALVAPQLQWNFLDFGRNKARVRQAEAARDEAEAQYRQTVLGALRDAEDSLSRFGARRANVAGLARAMTAADRAAALMQQRYKAGTATLIDTLDAERQRVTAEQNLTSATAGLTGDYIALQKALGLGWTAASPQAGAGMSGSATR